MLLVYVHFAKWGVDLCDSLQTHMFVHCHPVVILIPAVSCMLYMESFSARQGHELAVWRFASVSLEGCPCHSRF